MAGTQTPAILHVIATRDQLSGLPVTQLSHAIFNILATKWSWAEPELEGPILLLKELD